MSGNPKIIMPGRSYNLSHCHIPEKMCIRDRAYIERKVKPQLKELLTNYGEIAVIWFDTPELVTRQQSKELRE